MKRYDIISPDGFSFYFDPEDLHKSKSEAKKAIKPLILARYGKQGYYRDRFMNQLSLKEAVDLCTIKLIEI